MELGVLSTKKEGKAMLASNSWKPIHPTARPAFKV